MPGVNTPTTDREKAALLAYKIGIIPDLKTAYLAAENKAIEDVATKALKTYVSKWINSERVKQLSAYLDRILADRDADARQRGRDEAENERNGNRTTPGRNERTETRKTAPVANVDYYDPANQRKQINQIIQQAADDPKTQLDAIKAIQQTQRDDRQAAKDQQIQRFYLPVRCQSCPIREAYQARQLKKATK